MTNPSMRIRQGVNLPASIDNYSKVESRQEMGYKLNTFLGTVTGNPHIRVLMQGRNVANRNRDISFYGGMAPKNLHLRTAHRPYRTEVY